MPQATPESKELAIAFYNRGKELRNQQRLDDAIQQLKEALKISPDSVRIRKTLRDVAAQRFTAGNIPEGTVRRRVSAAMAKININRTTRRWSEVARLAEEALETSPLDPSLNAALGEACTKLGFPNVAWFAYDYALQHAPNDVDILVPTAELMEGMKQFSRALELWQRIAEFRQDTVADSKVNDLTAKVFMHSANFTSAKTAGDLDAATQQARTITGGHVAVESVPSQASAAETASLNRDPVEALLAIADGFVRTARLKDAVAVLNAAVEVSAGEKRCVELLELVSQGVE